MDRDPAARAEELLEHAASASKTLVDGLVSSGFLAGQDDEPARLKILEQARHMFVFVILSVLLEQRSGKQAADKATAEQLKDAFALELVSARKSLRALAKNALSSDDARELSQKLDSASQLDPFASYYASFEKMRKDEKLGPFGILAQQLSEEYFEASVRVSAYERVFMLAATLSDELIGRL